jgi:uncharacterized membrane protein
MDLGDLVPLAVTFVVVGIVIAFGLNILSDVRSDFTASSYEANATLDAIEANANVADKLPLLGLVVAAAIIIGVLLKAFRQ